MVDCAGLSTPSASHACQSRHCRRFSRYRGRLRRPVLPDSDRHEFPDLAPGKIAGRGALERDRRPHRAAHRGGHEEASAAPVLRGRGQGRDAVQARRAEPAHDVARQGRLRGVAHARRRVEAGRRHPGRDVHEEPSAISLLRCAFRDRHGRLGAVGHRPDRRPGRAGRRQRRVPLVPQPVRAGRHAEDGTDRHAVRQRPVPLLCPFHVGLLRGRYRPGAVRHQG